MTEKNITNLKSKKKLGFWEISMTAPLIGLFLRIPLANIIGNEGNGYLALNWEIFFLLYIFFMRKSMQFLYIEINKL